MTASLVKTIADFNTTLAAKVAVGATTATLTSATDDDGVSLPTGTYAFTIDRKNSNKEYIIATVTGTALTDIKTVTRGTGVATTGFALSHRKGAEVIISDHVAIKRIMNLLDGTTDLNASVPLKYDATATISDNKHLATKAYVDSVATGTAEIVNTAIVVSGIAGETIAAGELVYFSESDNEWMKTDADTLATVMNVKLGIALGSGTNGNPITGGVHVYGEYTTSGLTAGDLYYASNTAGAITNAVGTTPRVIGIAKSTTVLYFDPEFLKIPHSYAVDAVGTDSYAVTLSGAYSAYFPGMELSFKAGTANTGACTLAINGGAAKSIKKNVSEDLANGDIAVNQICKVTYDGTNFQLISHIPPSAPVVQTYTTPSSEMGDNTTRFDITNPAGTTFRYTYDGTGTDPSISLVNNPVGSLVEIKSNNIHTSNQGFFVITGAGANYFEVTNASGVAENDKTIGTGYITKSGTSVWTKPSGLKYVVVEVVGAGGAGGAGVDGGTNGWGGAGGGAGGYSKKTISASTLNSTEYYMVGPAGTYGANFAGGRTSAFGAHLKATGGTNGSAGSAPDGGIGGIGTLGDINIGGQDGSSGVYESTAPSDGTAGGTGGSSHLGGGGAGGPDSVSAGSAGKVYGGGGGGGGGSGNSASAGGNGAQGIVIITEYYA